MWRIYSPDRLGVRIRTTQEKLRSAIIDGIRDDGLKYRLREVEYMSQATLNTKLRELANDLNARFSSTRAADALLWKRLAFEHEKEMRLIVYREERKAVQERGIEIKVDAHTLIEDVLIDPRAPEEFVRAYQLYFRERLEFKGRVAKSQLYAEQMPIEILGIDPAEGL